MQLGYGNGLLCEQLSCSIKSVLIPFVSRPRVQANDPPHIPQRRKSHLRPITMAA